MVEQYEWRAKTGDPYVEVGRSPDYGLTPFLRLVDDVLGLLQLRPGHHLLDIGAGNGLVTLLLASHVARTLAVEPVAGLAELARRNLTGIPNVEVVGGEGAALPVDGPAFDRIAMISVLGLVSAPDVPAIFHEMRRVARPGARIVIGDCSRQQHDLDALADWWRRGAGAKADIVPHRDDIWRGHLVVQLPG